MFIKIFCYIFFSFFNYIYIYKISEITRIRSLEAKHLFIEEKDYERAFGIFLSLEIDPNEILQLYPMLNSTEEIIALKKSRENKDGNYSIHIYRITIFYIIIYINIYIFFFF